MLKFTVTDQFVRSAIEAALKCRGLEPEPPQNLERISFSTTTKKIGSGDPRGLAPDEMRTELEPFDLLVKIDDRCR